MTTYNLNVDLVYDNVYTKISINKSIRSQDIKKLISDAKQDPLLCCKFAKNDNTLSQTQILSMIMCYKLWLISVHSC